MRRLLVDVYRLMFLITGAKMFSVVIAIIYVTLLNMVVLSGLSLLMQGWMPTAFIHKLFTYPYYFFTGVVMLGLMIKYKPSKKIIAKEAKKTKDYTFIAIYTAVALILYLYIMYGDKVNFNAKKKLAFIESTHSQILEASKNAVNYCS